MWNEVEKALKDLEKCVSEYKRYNYDYAIKERKYRIALSKKLTELRASGEKVTFSRYSKRNTRNCRTKVSKRHCRRTKEVNSGLGIEENVVTLCPECHYQEDLDKILNYMNII